MSATTGYNDQDECNGCGEHIADPHAPGRPSDSDPATPVVRTVAAEDAPIGVQIWPTISREFDPNFTLRSVTIVIRRLRDASGTYENTYVEWTYESGKTRVFSLGEQVAIQTS